MLANIILGVELLGQTVPHPITHPAGGLVLAAAASACSLSQVGRLKSRLPESPPGVEERNLAISTEKALCSRASPTRPRT